jgi:hypothetical protein
MLGGTAAVLAAVSAAAAAPRMQETTQETLAASPAVIVLAQSQTGQDPAKPLPNIEVAPAPLPTPPGARPQPAPTVKPFQDQRRTLQLQVDPRTGRPLTNWEIRQRQRRPEDSRGPTPLFTPRGEARPSAVKAGKATKQKDISVKALDVIGLDSIGLLHPDDDGYPANTWQGTSFRLVSKVLSSLPVDVPSEAMRSLTWRLLLSSVSAPRGAKTKSGLLPSRLERIGAAGWHVQVLELLSQVPGESHAAEFAVHRLRALFALGRSQEACNLVRQQIERSDETDLQKAMAFCFALNGETAKLELYENLLYEADIDDPLFFALLDRLKGGAGKVENIVEVTSLHLAMLSAAGGAEPKKLAQAVPGGLAAEFTRLDGTSVDFRIGTALRAGALGLVAPETLAKLFDSVGFEPKLLKNPLPAVKKGPDGKAIALLYQAAKRAQDKADAATYIAAALRLSRQHGTFGIVASVFAPMIVEMPPIPALAWFAAEAGRVLLFEGNVAQARRWMVAAGPPARQGDNDAVGAILELTPLLYVGAGKEEIPLVRSALIGWFRAEMASERADRFRRAAVFLTLLDVFGRQVPDELWENLMIGPDSPVREPAPGVHARLRQAVADGRFGETVLFSLLAIGDKGPGGTSTELLSRVMEGLLKHDLREDARRLALETMVAEGF